MGGNGGHPGYHGNVPELKNIQSWTGHLGRSKLRSFTDAEWIYGWNRIRRRNPNGQSSRGRAHDVAWEFAGLGGAYTGRMLIDGEIYTPSEATKKFLQVPASKHANR